MGMSASQVRFLTLQGRKHSIGKQLNMLSNRKMALSRDMDTVAMRYNNALNQKLLKWSNNNGEEYNTLSYDLMMRPNELNWEKPYIITKASNGAVVLNSDKIMKPNGELSDLSYIDIAKMISSIVGLKPDNSPEYNESNAFYYDFDNTPKKQLAGGKPSEFGWFVPQVHDYNYNNTFRTSIYMQLGLLDEDYQSRENELLTQLYGSQKAQLSGVYSPDCLWGQYYVAVANLDAFENYMDLEHTFASSDNFGDTQHISEVNHNMNTVYTFTDNLGATKQDDNTTIHQINTNENNNGINPLAHLNFDGVYGSYTDVSYKTNVSGLTFTANVTDQGLTYDYEYESVWENGVSHYLESNTNLTICAHDVEEPITVGRLINAINVENKLRNPEQLIEIYHEDDHNPFDYDEQIVSISDDNTLYDNTIYNTLASMIDVFIDVMSSNTMVDLNKDDPKYAAMYNEAKQETIKLFMVNSDSEYEKCMDDRDEVKREASNAALDKNKLGIQRTGGKVEWAFWNSRTHGITEVYVDAGSLCNVFLSYFNQLSQGKPLNPVVPSVDYEPKIEFGNTEESVITEPAYLTQVITSYDSVVTSLYDTQVTIYDTSKPTVKTVSDAAETGTGVGDNFKPNYAEGTNTYSKTEVYDPKLGIITTETGKTYTRETDVYKLNEEDGTYELLTFENPYFDSTNPSRYSVFGRTTGTQESDELNGSVHYPVIDENGEVQYKKDKLYQTTLEYEYEYEELYYQQATETITNDDDTETTTLLFEDDGTTPIYVTDESGNPVIVDQDTENAILQTNADGTPKYRVQTDEQGNTLYDEDGNPKYVVKMENGSPKIKQVESYDVILINDTAYYADKYNGTPRKYVEVPKYNEAGEVMYTPKMNGTTQETDDYGHLLYTIEADNNGRPVYIIDENNQKQPVKKDGKDVEVIQRDNNGNAIIEEDDLIRYSNSDYTANYNSYALYRDADGNPVALFTCDKNGGNLKYNGDENVLSQQAAENIRAYNPCMPTGDDEYSNWNTIDDPSTWTSTLATIIKIGDKYMTLAQYYLEDAINRNNKADIMKYARCEEIKAQYTDFDECWSMYSSGDTANNSVRINYSKLVNYIPFSDYTKTTDSDGKAIWTMGDLKVTYNTETDTFTNNIARGDSTYGIYNNEDYSIVNVWVMDPANPSQLISLKDAYSDRSLDIKVNPKTGLPADPNIQLYIQFDERETSQRVYNPMSAADDNDVMKLTYTTDVNGVPWIYDSSDNAKNEPETIYGVLEYNLRYIYFTKKEALDAFIKHPNPSQLMEKLVEAENNPSLAAGVDGVHLFNPEKSMATDGYDDFYAQIEAYDTISKYNIAIEGYAINLKDEDIKDELNNTDIHKSLKDNIVRAQENIKSAEDALDDLYGKNRKYADYYDALFTRIAQCGWVVDENTSTQNKGENANVYLNNKLQNNDYFVTECESKDTKLGFNYTTKMAQNIRKIYSVYDDDSIDIALAQYECEKKDLQEKEKEIDLAMEKLETEQEAIQTTMESVKRVIDNNIKKTFKMFA